MKTQIKNFLFTCTILIAFAGQAQTGSPSTGSPSTESSRVSFTIKNPTLKNKLIGFSSYDFQQQKLRKLTGIGNDGAAE